MGKRFTSILHNIRFYTTHHLHLKATKWSWYKIWHDKKYSHHVHLLIFFVYTASVIFAAFVLPGRSYAALTEQNLTIDTEAEFTNGTFSNSIVNGDQVELENATLSNSNGGDWAYRKKVTVDNTSGGDLSNYSMLIDSEKDLVGHWNFDETSGTAYDSSWSGNNGTVVGANQNVTGKYGNGISFDGVDDYVDLGDVNNSESTNGSFELWINPNTLTGSSAILSKSYTSETISKWLKLSNGILYFELYNGSWYTVETPPGLITTDSWHHIVATWGAGGMHLFVNGLEVDSNIFVGDGYTSSYALVLGEWKEQINGTYGFNGKVDDFKIYNRGLTADEIWREYHGKRPLFFDGASIDGSDLRFTDSDGRTELPYYLENFNNSTTGKKNYRVWVKTDVGAGTTKDIYMYYGNSSATSSSNGNNVFELYEDGDGSIDSDIIINTAGTATVTNIASKLHVASSSIDSGYLFGKEQGSNPYCASTKVTQTSDSSDSSSLSVLSVYDGSSVPSPMVNTSFNPNVRVEIGRNSPSNTYSNMFYLHYISSAGTHYFWHGTGGWSTSTATTRFFGGSGEYRATNCFVGNKYALDIKDSSGKSIINGPAYINSSDVYAISNGRVVYSGDQFTSHYYLGQNFDDYYVTTLADNQPIVIEYSGFSRMPYKKDITFDTTATGASVATDQYNFPVAIEINSSSWPDQSERDAFFNNAGANGKSIQFWDSGETYLLDYEVEYFDSVSKEALYWVKVPKIDGNSNTDKIEVAYGKDYDLEFDDIPAVWSNGYLGVYHHADGSNSVSSSYPMSVFGATVINSDLGKAHILDGDNDYLLLNNTTDDISFSLEVYGKKLDNQYNSAYFKGYYILSTNAQYSLINFEYNDNLPEFVVRLNSNQVKAKATQTINNNQFYYLAGVKDTSNLKLFVNNDEKITATGAPNPSSGYGWYTVQNPNNMVYYPNVVYSETRYSAFARTDDWMKLSYFSMAKTIFSGDGMINFGSQMAANYQPFGYQTSGTYTSSSTIATNVIDMGWIGSGSWSTVVDNFTASVTIPSAEESITFEAKTGHDHDGDGTITWAGTWQNLGTATTTGTFVGNNTAWDALDDDTAGYSWNYLQVRATLSSTDGASTPVISSYTITFGTDITDPVNPTSATAYTNNTKGTEITNNTFTNEETPYLEWAGASDGVGESGLDCYYIYFGTDINADPETAGLEIGGNNCHTSENMDLTTVDTNPLVTASSGDIFYLRIDTKDIAGNVNDMPNGQALFTYKFDETEPTNPTQINRNPVGWTNVNSFSFDWPSEGEENGGSDIHSTVCGYEYKRGNGTDSWSYTTNTDVAGIEAYQNGTNVFMLRAKDCAGNVADSTLNTNYYYSANAPSEPQNLTVTPNSNTSNAFNFTWDKPFSYNEGIKGYRWSINALPSVDNTVYLASSGEPTSTGVIAAATQQGLNTFYVVAIDNTDNVNYANFASIQFECNTAAPGAPLNPVISDISNRETENWALAISWNTPVGGGAVDHYRIYRSTDDVNYAQVGTSTTTTFAESGLSNEILYYYKIYAVDNAASLSAPSTIVSDQPTGKFTEPPAIVSGPNVTATAVGAIVTWSTDRPSSSFVEYSKDTSYSLSNGSLAPLTSHTVELSGLDPSSTYNFRVQSLDENRDYAASEAYSQNYTFATSAAPGISEVKISDISLSSAIVSWKTTSSATSAIKYGVSTSYGQEVVDKSSSQTTLHTIKLSNLNHSTTYNFKITGTDIDNNYMESDNYVFSTLTYPRYMKKAYPK